MCTGGSGGLRRCVQKWGTLLMWDADLWKLSILIEVFLARLLDLLAVGRVRRDVWKVINGDTVYWKIGNG